MEVKKFWLSDMEALLGVVLVLVILGIINVFSSSFVLSENDYGTPYHFLVRHFFNLFLGLCFLIAGAVIDYHNWRRAARPLFLLTAVLLVLVLLFGATINGAKRWLNLVFFQIQPAEIAKLVTIMLSASYLSFCLKQKKEPKLFPRNMIMVLILGGLVEAEPDMGTSLIVVGVPVILVFLAGKPLRKAVPLLVCGFSAIAALCVWQPYRMRRIMVMLDPWSDVSNVGYQSVQSMSAIGSGGLWGMGLGVGVSKYAYLPEAHTDFAFAIFSQENGFLGAVFVFILYAALAYYIARIAGKAADAYGHLLASGIMILLVGQAIANMLMVGGILPVVGVPLPFISYGGTSLLVSMAAVGILLNIGRQGRQHLPQEKKEKATKKEFAAKRRLRLVK